MSYRESSVYSIRKAPSKPYKTLIIKLTSEEHVIILKKAVESGLAISEYVRLAALDGETLKNSSPKRRVKYRSMPVKIITH